MILSEDLRSELVKKEKRVSELEMEKLRQVSTQEKLEHSKESVMQEMD